ncbi:substrate-binding domain-containing protein [Kitasatospora sp. NPDC057015]|uniref:substrate-binding domain-containing protein n=1 Tax=Kitasatospora sp. NPDC057015 TaxID=3346001 RepID=UPI00362EE9AB
MRTTAAKLLTAAALAASLLGAATGTAVADPPVAPPANSIVGVGVRVTQALYGQFSTDYNAQLTGAGDTTSPRLYSWDADGSATIVPKVGAGSVPRPRTSDTGLQLLDTTTAATVDYVRSDRGPQAGDPVSDLFVVLAKDAVTWSAKAAGGNAPANLTTADLKNIYNGVYTTWDQITDIAGYAGPHVAIKPYLPQTGSSTRAFFLKTIGVTTPGANVLVGPQEDEGTDVAFSDPNVVFPYSVGHYVGQVYGGHATVTDAPGYLSLRSVNGVAPITPTHTVNPALAAGPYGRTFYSVVRVAEWNATDAHGAALRNIFGPGGWICTAGQADIRSYGFLTVAACGGTTHS